MPDRLAEIEELLNGSPMDGYGLDRIHIDWLIAEVKRLRVALDASHSHVYAKPGCRTCEVLGLPHA